MVDLATIRDFNVHRFVFVNSCLFNAQLIEQDEKKSTVFPHIVSAETILFWIQKSKGHST